MKKKKFFVGPLKVNDENSRIRIRQRHGSADPDLDSHQNVMDHKHFWNAEFFGLSLMSYTFFGLVDQGEVCQRPTTNAINIEDLIGAGGVSVASKYDHMT